MKRNIVAHAIDALWGVRLLGAVGALLLFYLLHKGIHLLIVKVARIQRGSFAETFVRACLPPLEALLLILLLFELGRYLEIHLLFPSLYEPVYTMAVGVCATLALSRLTKVMLASWRSTHPATEDRTVTRWLSMITDQGMQLFLVVTMGLMTLHNMGVNISSALTSLAIGSAALGMAAQDTLAHIFGTMAILAEGTFKVGDRVRIDGVEGVVLSIGLRSTLIRSEDGHLVTVPNRSMGNAVVSNMSHRQHWLIRQELILSHQLGAEEVAAVDELVRTIAHSQPHVIQCVVGVKSLTQKGLHLEVKSTLEGCNHQEYVRVMHQLNLEIKKALDEHHISLQG